MRILTNSISEGEGLRMRVLAALAAGLLSLSLAGCNTSSVSRSGPSVAPLIAVAPNQLVGNWGLASFQNAADRERTVAQAKVACGNPYQVGAGSQGGVIMHLPDQSSPTEVFLKVASDGQTYLGPRGAPGMRQDRLITSFDGNLLTTDWVDPGIRSRYGTMVLVRCGAAA